MHLCRSFCDWLCRKWQSLPKGHVCVLAMNLQTPIGRKGRPPARLPEDVSEEGAGLSSRGIRARSALRASMAAFNSPAALSGSFSWLRWHAGPSLHRP